MNQLKPSLLEHALTMHAAGLAVVPLAVDGTKRPSVSWKRYQQQGPSEYDVKAWFDPRCDVDGLGVLTGAVSGGLVMLEAEGRAVAEQLVEQLAAKMREDGRGALWDRLCAGWMELTPSGGMHWHARVVDQAGQPVDVGGNTKLARRPGAGETPVEVLFETRGEGGFTVVAPSAGRSHPTGGAWMRLAGGPDTIPTLTVEEYDAVKVAMSTFDTMPGPAPYSPRPAAAGAPVTRTDADGLRPGDDFNVRASWDDILGARGWTKGHVIAGRQAWTRPGKHPSAGMSATTGGDTDLLYVFTTSTEFDAEKPYDKLGAIALLEHGGDIAEAAKALRGRGYGSPVVERHLSIVPGPDPALVSAPAAAEPVAVPPPATDGTSALQIAHDTAPAARTLAHSDDANALLLVERYGDQLRYCADRGRWYAWNGVLWEACHRNAGPARELAKAVARDLPELDKKDTDFKKKTLSAVGISNMLAQAASVPAITVTYGQLDAQPWELNTPGGIVDLRTGTIGSADPGRLHTRTTSCTPDWSADRTLWLDFLSVTFNGDQQLIEYMQRLVGYSAVGTVGAHVLPYCYGSGGNGKGVFLEATTKVLGDYATTAPAGFLMAKNFQGHETEIARLAGARMVVCSEVNEDDRFDEARVKQLTGGDSLTARFMQQDHFTFTPSHQLWAMGNHQPHVRSGGPSFWRRLRLIPFVHTVPDSDVIEGLQDILASEHGPAVLSWIIDGAVAYGRHGLRDPEAVLAASTAYQRDQDTVARFLDEACRLGGAPLVQTKVGLVRDAYEAWCREAGDLPVSAKAFGTALQRRGIETKRTNSNRFYVGLHLVDDDAAVQGDLRFGSDR